jgi:hypothetical protein
MSTKSNANSKAIELTQAELDSVTGGAGGAGGATFNQQINQPGGQQAAEAQKIANEKTHQYALQQYAFNMNIASNIHG